MANQIKIYQTTHDLSEGQVLYLLKLKKDGSFLCIGADGLNEIEYDIFIGRTLKYKPNEIEVSEFRIVND